MDDERVDKLAEILIACHGANAESAARKRANRCQRRRELEWAALWAKVAEHIAKRGVATLLGLAVTKSAAALAFLALCPHP